ncbi:MAG: EAL domain-containing response regulator [Polyangiaceae bacterium]|nr:EAL domain-containing response regulator [Polyangiaceae bacterium]
MSSLNQMKSTKPPSTVPGHKQADILLVDDDDLVLRAVERILVTGGYTVVKAYDGQVATREAMSGNYGVIVSDIHMPGVKGTELLDVLRSYGNDVPVVLMTGSPTFETARDAVDLGAVTYLTKPIDRDALLRAVSRARKIVRKPRPSLPEIDQAASFERAMDSLWMAYQPIVSMTAHGPIAYEALVRSQEPGFLGPGPLFAYAEKAGRLPDLGRKIRQLCATAVTEVPDGMMLFVNVHADDLSDVELFSPLSPLSEHADRVVLEITERGAIEEVRDVVDRVTRLRALGYRLAIDDLGAGYAGLSSVAMLEPDFVKLDMSLTRDLASSPVRMRLVGSMVDACRDVGMRLVAEGVETVQELRALCELGCDLLQGYHFARPSPDFVHVTTSL